MLVLGLSLVSALPASAAAPTVALTTPAGGITSLTGTPLTSGTEAGVHSIVISDATASTLTGADAESNTANDTMASSLGGTETLSVTIAGEAITTGALAAATADTTLLTAVAADIQAKINAATTVADVTVTVTGTSNTKKFLITVNLAGVANSITGVVTGTNGGETETGLAGAVTLAAGADAKAVDTFDDATGSNGLWVAANGGDTKTITHTTTAGTDSTLAGLKPLVIAANAFINGITLVAPAALSADNPVVTVTAGTAGYLKVTGTAVMDAGDDNELTVTAYDDAANRATAYTGNKNLTFSGPGVAPDGTVPTVEATAVGTVIAVAFTNGVTSGTSATLIAYKVETTTVDVTDGTISSTGNAAYDLDLTVNGMNLNKAFYTTSEVMTIVVGDSSIVGDPMAIDTIIVAVTSDTDLVGDDTVTLTETGSNTEIFSGTANLIPLPPANRTLDQVVVSEGDTITVDYDSIYIETATVDETAPEFAADTEADEEYYANGDTITLTVTLDDEGYIVTADFSEIDSEYTAGDQIVVDNADNTYTVTYDISADNTMADDEYTITVAAEDGAGNPADAAGFTTSVAVNLDNTGPAVTNPESDPAVIQPDTATDVTFSANVTDEGSGIDTVTINLDSIGGADDQAMVDNGDGSWGYDFPDLDLADEDIYELTITATDALGNSDNATAITFTVAADTTDPVITDPAIEYPFDLSSARPGDEVTISASVTDDILMDTVTADSDAFAAAIDLLDDGVAPDETAGDGIYTGTATIADADEGEYTVTINATDAATNEATDESLTCTVDATHTGYDIDLAEGWNLISTPLIPDDSDIAVVLADITDNVSVIWAYIYDEDGFASWKVWGSGPATLTEIVDGQGYWIEMTADNTLTVTGTELPAPPNAPPAYNLYAGWNLIGFKSVDVLEADVYLGATVTAGVVRMYGYDAVGGVYTTILVTADSLQPGQGYWLAVSADGTIYP